MGRRNSNREKKSHIRRIKDWVYKKLSSRKTNKGHREEEYLQAAPIVQRDMFEKETETKDNVSVNTTQTKTNTETERESKHPGSQCTSMAFTAILTSGFLPVGLWTPTIMDRILFLGDKLHACLLAEMGRWAPCNGHLAADEMPSQPKDTHGIWGVKCKRNLEYQGFIDPDLTCLSSLRRQLTECGMPDERLRDLDDAISSCFSAGSAGCLLTSCGVSSAIFKNPEGGVVVFDSHAKDVTGRTCSEGKSSLLTFISLDCVAAYYRSQLGGGDQILPYGVPGPAKLDKGSSWSELLQTLTDALSNRAPLPPAGQ